MQLDQSLNIYEESLTAASQVACTLLAGVDVSTQSSHLLPSAQSLIALVVWGELSVLWDFSGMAVWGSRSAVGEEELALNASAGCYAVCLAKLSNLITCEC